MAHQSPMISIPKKTTDDVDWTTPIRSLIAQSYGENPDNYAAECASLQRCRQDAVRGAGSDITARDLLYKYFGQLELLELRFSEIRVNFPWRDAFTNKMTMQTSIAYEKASVLFQIAATHSSIASSQSRSDPEGIKRAFHYFRTCAGMLTYINENFLHAPSTDLSREVIKFLVNIILAQATEVFFEKCATEKKGNALISKIGAQAASMYASLTEEVKEFMGKGIFDRNWVTLIQIKAKYFSSLSQYYRGLADSAAGRNGDALVRFTLAETQAKEAARTASSFNSVFVPTMSPTLAADSGPAIHERMKAHVATLSSQKSDAQRENDLIYNAILPSPDALPPIDKTSVATPIPIQEVYSSPDVQKTIGQDFFIRLVPLSVHESASVYSEEKAKLVRGEVEKAEGAEGEAKSFLDGLGIRDGLGKYRAMVEDITPSDTDLPTDVRRWKEDISLMETRESVQSLLARLESLKSNVKSLLDEATERLDAEVRSCETMRVKYEHRWTQSPSASHTKELRNDLKSHYTSLEAAAKSDQQVNALWQLVAGDIRILTSSEIESVFAASLEEPPSGSLLDLDGGDDAASATEKEKIKHYIQEIDERLGRLNKIARERNEVLKDLKEKIQTDDVSHLLLLNRRNSGVEPALFAAELEKFKPYQHRLTATLHHQSSTIQEIGSSWKALRDLTVKGAGMRRWEAKEKRRKELLRRFSSARDGYMEVKDGLAKGLNFYTELIRLSETLQQNARAFVASRTSERDALVGQLELEKRLSSASSPPPLAAKPVMSPPPPLPARDIASSFASMNIGSGAVPHQPSWENRLQHVSPFPTTYQGQNNATPPFMPSPPLSQPLAPPLPPPPPQPSFQSISQPSNDPYASLGAFGVSSPPPPLPNYGQPLPPPQSNYYPGYNPYANSPPPPPPPSQQPGYGGWNAQGPL